MDNHKLMRDRLNSDLTKFFRMSVSAGGWSALCVQKLIRHEWLLAGVLALFALASIIWANSIQERIAREHS